MLSGAQVWTVIGGFFGVLAVLVTLVLGLVISTRAYLDAKFEAVGARFDNVNQRLDAIDRDVQALVTKVFRDQ